MHFVQATLEDLKELKELEDEAFLEFNESRNEKDLTYEINENPFAKFLLAKEENEIVGFINYWVTFDSATINQIAVKKSYQRKGIATKLLVECEKDIKNQDVEFLTLEVRERNIKAKSLYEKFGFMEITVKEKYYEDGENAIYMVKGEI